jgi:hypothetical protein
MPVAIAARKMPPRRSSGKVIGRTPGDPLTNPPWSRARVGRGRQACPTTFSCQAAECTASAAGEVDLNHCLHVQQQPACCGLDVEDGQRPIPEVLRVGEAERRVVAVDDQAGTVAECRREQKRDVAERDGRNCGHRQSLGYRPTTRMPTRSSANSALTAAAMSTATSGPGTRGSRAPTTNEQDRSTVTDIPSVGPCTSSMCPANDAVSARNAPPPPERRSRSPADRRS